LNKGRSVIGKNTDIVEPISKLKRNCAKIISAE
jgi:hypothetical protein